MTSSVINQPTSVVEKFNTIIKIYKYIRLHEGQHFIPMTMEVHGAPCKA
jgi:ubiquitin C-terminal hydrolase